MISSLFTSSSSLFLDSLLYTEVSSQNSFELPSKKEYEDGKWFKVRFVIHSHKDFSIGQVSSANDVASFAQDFFLDSSQDDSQEKMEYEYMPIIHITLDDSYVGSLFSICEKSPVYISRSFQILDSSIWNKIVPFVENEKYKVGGSKGLYDTIAEIDTYYSQGLYNLQVTHEYANLNARLAKQAFLNGAHSSGVSPFIFHSESTAKQLILREFKLKEESKLSPYDVNLKYEKGSLMEKICKHRWRILLLDDKAIEPMETIAPRSENDKRYGGWNSKKSIICKLWEDQFCLKNNNVAFRPVKRLASEADLPLDENIAKMPDKKTVILIEYAQNLDEAREALKDRKYDLVLIDYLLNEKTGTHYGYELLEDIWNDQEQHKNDEDHLIYKTIRPHRHLRMYCMFISAYSSAVHDRLLAEGLNQSEKYWYINLGACPTNTPQLFLYNLIKLMCKRLEDAYIGRLSVNGLMKVLKRIYGGVSIRKSSGELYEKIQSLQYFYRNQLQDYDISVGEEKLFEAKGSVLVTHFLNDNINMGGLLEHLAQLVHLTAFGTVRQWPEMWEEYLFVKAELEALIDDKDADMVDSCNQVCNKIENHILKLKSSAL